MSQVVYKAYCGSHFSTTSMAQILFNLDKIVFADCFSCFHFFWIKPIHSKRKTFPYIFVTLFCVNIYFVFIFINTKMMLLICTRFLKNQFGKINFYKLGFSLCISNWIFTDCVACQNQFRNRLLQAKNLVSQT